MLAARSDELREFRESGELSDICVTVDGVEFRLHKFALFVNSEFFRSLCRCGMADEDRVELSRFPGGAKTFSLVADYCYGQEIDFNSTNVAQLRCAAEFLQMTSHGNLASETTVAVARILRSPHHSISALVDIISKCCQLGAIANQTDVISSCFAVVIELWKNGKLPETVIEVLLELPVEWFVGLAVGARDRSISTDSIARLTSEYLQMQVDEQWGSIKASLSINDKDSGYEDAVSCESEDFVVGEIMDHVLLELPDDAPLSDVMDNGLLCLLFRVAARFRCKCEGILMRAISRKLSTISQDILVTMPTENIVSIIDYNVHNDAVAPKLLCDTLDGYLWARVKRKDIDLDEFHTTTRVIPKDYRQQHDSLMMIAQELFSTEKPSEETMLKILEAIEPHRLHEETLRLISEKKVIPSSFIVTSALAVSSRLRNELTKARAELEDKDTDMRKMHEAVADVIKGQWESNDIIVNVAPKDAHNTQVQFAKVLARNTSTELSMEHETYEGKLTLCVRGTRGASTQGLFLFDPFNEHLIEIKRSKYDNLMVGENYQKKTHTTSYWPFNDAS